LIAIPAGSFAEPETQAVQPAPKQATKSDIDKVVCRMQDEIGSRLRAHKVCMTVGQWRDNEREYKEHLQEMQDLAPTRPSG
jgi:hypothetical protein